MNVGVDITLDRSVSSGINLCPKNRVRFRSVYHPGCESMARLSISEVLQ